MQTGVLREQSVLRGLTKKHRPRLAAIGERRCRQTRVARHDCAAADRFGFASVAFATHHVS